MNFIAGFPKSKKGSDLILVVISWLSKIVHFFRLKTILAASLHSCVPSKLFLYTSCTFDRLHSCTMCSTSFGWRSVSRIHNVLWTMRLLNSNMIFHIQSDPFTFSMKLNVTLPTSLSNSSRSSGHIILTKMQLGNCKITLYMSTPTPFLPKSQDEILVRGESCKSPEF